MVESLILFCETKFRTLILYNQILDIQKLINLEKMKWKQGKAKKESNLEISKKDVDRIFAKEKN